MVLPSFKDDDSPCEKGLELFSRGGSTVFDGSKAVFEGSEGIFEGRAALREKFVPASTGSIFLFEGFEGTFEGCECH